jgi:hypothetical protein
MKGGFMQRYSVEKWYMNEFENLITKEQIAKIEKLLNIQVSDII